MNGRIQEMILRLEQERELKEEEYPLLIRTLLEDDRREEREFLFARARAVRELWYGKNVFIRGLLEVTNMCKNDCFYCGIRRSNSHVIRYRMTEEEILSCCQEGYQLGFRTFVLQGGEDPALTDEAVEDLVKKIKKRFPDCAVTLSLGEKEKESYQRFYEAGARRYLLRHETACPGHYRKLHPPSMSWEHRIRCLENLKNIGFQTGCGCMVGSPFQTPDDLGADLRLIHRLKPEMVGIGPFLPQKDTPFGKYPGGTLSGTLVMLSLVRLMLPRVLLPATTALGTMDPRGRELGILAGANVVMPNISPEANRKQYLLYDHKLGTGEESKEGLDKLRQQMKTIGYQIVTDKGDCLGWKERETYIG